jgi:hypothetical protein
MKKFKPPSYRIIWKEPIRVYQQGSARKLWVSFGVDPKRVARIRNGMPKPRRAVFEFWKGSNGKFFCHLKIGKHIVAPSQGYSRMRQVNRLFNILIERRGENTIYRERPVKK